MKNYENAKSALKSLVNCYQEKFYSSEKEEGSKRLFIHDESEPIFWGHSNILKADLSCLKQLLINDQDSRDPWKYFLNLAGSELPLKSDVWTRTMLMNLPEEQNIIDSFELPEDNLYRADNPWYLKW